MTSPKRPARPLPRQRGARHALITGGAGFIGANLAHRLASQGRPGDQAWFVADTRGFGLATGWRPRTGVAQGVAALAIWLRESRTAGDGHDWAREASS